MEREKSKRQHILFLTPQLPYPPEQGTAIRNFNLIRQVSRHFGVSLLSFADRSPQPQHLATLQQFCQNIWTVPVPSWPLKKRLRLLLSSADPDLAHRLRSSTFSSVLRRILKDHPFDALQIEGLEMAPYGLEAQSWPEVSSPPLIFDAHNAEYVLQRRAFTASLSTVKRWPAAIYSLVQWHRIRRFERLVCQQAWAVLAVSQLDAQALKKLFPALRPLLVPNGVDTSLYHPGLRDSLPLEHPALVFTGKMDFRPNCEAAQWFIKAVWPHIQAQIPKVHLYIVGKNPPPQLQRFQSPQIHITGYVKDILPYFGGADVYIVPLLVGGGTRLKVLEAMAAALPIVSTQLGIEGIPLQNEKHALIAQDAPSFARKVIYLLKNPRTAQSLGQAARAFVQKRYTWEVVTLPLLKLYTSLPYKTRGHKSDDL